MAFDGVMLRAVVNEISRSLAGGRVTRVFQPEPHEVTLEVYAGRLDHTLLLSCHPRHARVHLTTEPRRNPSVPPAFCMLLRKHLVGGRVEAVEQDGLERLLRLVIANVNDLGDPVRLTLVAELMGKHSNVILLDGAGHVLDALRRLPAGINRRREVLPGRPYVPPQSQDKLPLVPFDPAALAARWRPPAAPPTASSASLTGTAASPTAGGAAGDGAGPSQPAWRRLVDLIAGLGPVNAREALFRAGLDAGETPAAGLTGRDLDAIGRTLAAMSRDVAAAAFLPTARRTGAPPPTDLHPDGQVAVPPYSALELTMLAPSARLHDPSPSRLLDRIYEHVEGTERFRRERQRLAHAVGTYLERLRRKLAAQEEERREAAAAEDHRRSGELLTTHLHLIRPGMTEIRVPDYHDPAGGERVIPLDPRLGPAANAQVYFKRYQKGKRALAAVAEKLAQTLEDIRYLEGVEASLEAVDTLAELAEVAAELAAGGYLTGARRDTGRPGSPHHPRRGGAAPRRPDASGEGDARSAGRPLSFVSSDGLTILVGKNNRQNDDLTLRQAAPNDLWLHAKDIPGSHVVVRLPAGGGTRQTAGTDTLDAVPPRTLAEAAALAAYYSKARHSSKVPVDVTRRRHVRKPRGARPGFVIYTDQRTLYVTPGPEAIQALRSRPAPASR